MPNTLDRMLERLPTLYRPEPGDRDLLTLFLDAVADRLDAVEDDAMLTLQSRWFDYADRAQFSPYFYQFARLRRPPSKRKDQEDRERNPYIHDLARLAALLPLPPGQQPPLQETVENYRRRIASTVKLYRTGLGTLGALRRIIEALLMVELSAPDMPDRPFWIEEFAPFSTVSLPVRAPGEPLDLVGPLMRWTVKNVSLLGVPLTVLIRGVKEIPQQVNATTNPMIELFRGGSRQVGLALLYNDILRDGVTLRLRPAFFSFLGTAGGLSVARSLPGETLAADPTAPGPWKSVAVFPGGEVGALLVTHDNALWVASQDMLLRYDGQSWKTVLKAAPVIHCLAENDAEDTLLVGTENGLLRLPLFANNYEKLSPKPKLAALTGPPVFAIQQVGGQIWVGSRDGAALLEDFDRNQAGLLQGSAVYAIYADPAGTIFFGGEMGLVEYQPGAQRWFYYQGENYSEQAGEWQELKGFTKVPEKKVFLPPVRAILRGKDASLWLATDKGLARYRAVSDGGLSYQTVLEAFPDLTAKPLYAAAQDERGLTWFAGQDGLFRFDGRDFWQYQPDAWALLGPLDPVRQASDQPQERGAWRFLRDGQTWQRFETASRTWQAAAFEPVCRPLDAVYCIAWCDSVQADLGEWGLGKAEFSSQAEVEPKALSMRIKPDIRHCYPGGIPAVPRLPAGESVWRYLSLEIKAELPDPPGFSSEGRLLLPAVPGIPEEKFERGSMEMGVPGRYEDFEPPPNVRFDQGVYPYLPAAQVHFRWQPRQVQAVLCRLKARTPNEKLDPLLLDRIWQGMQVVRPVGVALALAVEEDILRR